MNRQRKKQHMDWHTFRRKVNKTQVKKMIRAADSHSGGERTEGGSLKQDGTQEEGCFKIEQEVNWKHKPITKEVTHLNWNHHAAGMTS